MRPFSMRDARDIDLDGRRSSFSWAGQRVHLQLRGQFNIANAIAAATAARELGVPVATIAEGLARVAVVPGRFEPIDGAQPFSVFVDYAHTPAALASALTAARAAAQGRLIVVFGCGGDRDPTKRAPMGATATRLADLVVVTSDNPRTEDPEAIIADVLEGVQEGAGVIVEPDRRLAIRAAIGEARRGDVVVIAGKGHETAQLIGDRSIPFDDREVARESIGW